MKHYYGKLNLKCLFRFSIFYFAFFLFLIPHFASAQCSLTAPQNLVTSNVTPCSATLSWKKLANTRKYLVKYQKTGTSGWIANYSVKDTFFNFTGLESKTKYTLSVQGVCKAGGAGVAAKTKVFTSNCALPLTVSKFTFNESEEKITVTTSCPFDTLYCNYGAEPGSLTYSAVSETSEIVLNNLQSGITYYFQLSTCPLVQNNFTATDSFKVVVTRPNIILIVLDDARYDQYSCNGAPSFMQTPNIDRIANEGINFKNSFVVHSECAPGRATIATGDYTSRHGVFDNLHPSSLNPDLPLLPSILHSNGYYTALIGKNHDIYSYDAGYFNYWFEYLGATSFGVNQFNYQGTEHTIYGYDADVMSDTALSVIDKATEPYYIQLAYRVPHDPLLPAVQYDHTFDGDQVDLGSDTARYTVNYPSFLYQLSGGAIADAYEAQNDWRETLEMLLSVNDGVGAIFNKLDSNNELDHTMIIFTSDNGHLIGEHRLGAKRFAYEPSLRVPLFIRYPKWFSAGSIDTSNLALNIDYAPTIIDAAGVEDTFHMDGTSLNQFYNGTSSRTTMYYHYWYSTEGTWKYLPPIHAVRDKHYVLIDYGCANDTTEEFFDLINDPLEMTNQINNSAYSSLVNAYRNTLASLKLQYADTSEETQLNCNLANEVWNKQSGSIVSSDFVVFPNPAYDVFNIANYGDKDIYFVLMNELGEETEQFTLEEATSTQIHVPSPGFYLLVANDGKQVTTVKLLSH